MTEIERKPDTLVLSGGAVNGFITLGAMQYLVDKNYTSNITKYVCTSSGSIISYLLAIGYTPIEIMVSISINNFLSKMNLWDINSAVVGNGATTFNYVHETLEKMTIEKIGKLITLQELKNDFGKELYCVAYNITKDKTEYLSAELYPTLPCITALRMSCNLPLIFGHFKYMNCYFLDGGISDNFPVEYASKIGNKILGLNLDAVDAREFNPSTVNILEYIYRILFIPVKELIKNRIEKSGCDVISLKCNKKTVFDFNIHSAEKLDLFSSGYNQAKIFLESDLVRSANPIPKELLRKSEI